MENASKALFIVVGVILGVLLLSVMIYVFRQGSRVNEAYDQKQITNQLELYNSRFEEFDKEDNNIIEAISLANLAYDTNVICDYDPTLTVEVEIEVGGDTFTIPRGNELSERNTILNDTNHVISIYNLADLTLNELGVVPGTIQGSGAQNTDKLSTTKLKDGKTIYKYLFRVENFDDFKYYEHNGKVSGIKLTAYVNPAWSL